ncbi:hypothetical protein ONZ45_g17273 [Pleurotus djamor]|nr:hypothetical protein ONZ45_g17273 [Pleurotus djamor]
MHPRPSILAMFDPLALSRGMVQESEKENATPPRQTNSGNPLTMTAVFNRTYKTNTQVAQPTFRKRLVDIGEVTVDEASILALGLEELREEMEDEDELGDDEADTTVIFSEGPKELLAADNYACSEPVTPKASTTRVPLAELAFENEYTPMLRASRSPASTDTGTPPPTLLVETGEVVDSSKPCLEVDLVTSEGPTEPTPSTHDAIHTPGPDTTDADVELELESTPHLASATSTPLPPSPTASLPSSPDASLPVITFSEAPLETPVSDFVPVELPTDCDTSPSQLAPRPRIRAAGSIDIDDPRRCSVDLQQSFCLQMQCPDSSFDLLNDKISFLANVSEMEPFLEEDEDSFTLDITTLNRHKEVPLPKERTPMSSPGQLEVAIGKSRIFDLRTGSDCSHRSSFSSTLSNGDLSPTIESPSPKNEAAPLTLPKAELLPRENLSNPFPRQAPKYHLPWPPLSQVFNRRPVPSVQVMPPPRPPLPKLSTSQPQSVTVSAVWHSSPITTFKAGTSTRRWAARSSSGISSRYIADPHSSDHAYRSPYARTDSPEACSSLF